MMKSATPLRSVYAARHLHCHDIGTFKLRGVTGREARDIPYCVFFSRPTSICSSLFLLHHPPPLPPSFSSCCICLPYRSLLALPRALQRLFIPETRRRLFESPAAVAEECLRRRIGSPESLASSGQTVRGGAL